MRVAVPKEIKNNEFRVAITPAGVHDLVLQGHEVVIETGAGVGSSIPDEAYIGGRRIDRARCRHAPGQRPTCS